MTLKEARKRKGLTLEEVAKKLKVTASTISKYEKGTIIPNAIQIETFLKLYDIKYDDLKLLHDNIFL